MSNNLYNDEKSLIEWYVYSHWLHNNNPKHSQFKNLLHEYRLSEAVELIIRPECNQKCEYCYITKHGNNLFPLDERKNNNELLNNLLLILNYFEESKILIPELEIFAGDLFYDNLIYEVFNLIYNYYNKIAQRELFYFAETKRHKFDPIVIIFPCNFSFINNPEHLPKIKEWQNKFKALNIVINFSVSADGKYATQVRENKNNDEVDEYYDKIFNVARELGAGFHPMISASSIETACENYDWWINQIKKFSNEKNSYRDFAPMMLEVRNPREWTSDKIEKYVHFLDHVINKRLEMCHNSIEELTYHLFVGDGKNNTLRKLDNYEPLSIGFHYQNGILENNTTCSLGKTLHINLSNLNIVPCHRLTYYQFAGGEFIVENNKIIGINPINPSGYIGITSSNFHMQPKCQSCTLQSICIKGCYGAQYEYTGEVFIPINSICQLYFEKYKKIFTKYFELGVIHELINKKYIPDDRLNEIIKICKFYNLPI